jgi:beta-lactamase class A
MNGTITRRDALLWACGSIACGRFASASPISVIADYERNTGGHLGLYAQNIKTGAKLAFRADERFVMCSTFKASLAACVLARVDQGQEELGTLVHYGAADLQDFYAPVAQENLSKGVLSVKDLCKAAVERSDNACANLLLARIGGPAALTTFWRKIGDAVTRLDDYEPLLNRTPPGGVVNTTTPAAMANTLRRLALGDILAEVSRATFTEWLVNCQTGANRLRAGLPQSWVIGDKTGNNGQDAAGDIVIAWPKSDVPIVICVYTRGGSPTSAQFDAVFADLGRFVAAQLGH